MNIVPGGEFHPRKVQNKRQHPLPQPGPSLNAHIAQGFLLKDIIKQARERDYTDMIVINEDKKSKAPDAIVLTHLPDGPTAHFKLTSIKYPKEIPVRWGMPPVDRIIITPNCLAIESRSCH